MTVGAIVPQIAIAQPDKPQPKVPQDSLLQPLTSISSVSATKGMEQVTAVSQLSDVQPTDWAFQALQSLVERYGCIAGYPDSTFRGNRAITRYEFAAGLNACLDRINELIATDDFASKEDLVAFQRLQEEFAAELATLSGQVDALEMRSATVEAQQFAPTSKLMGEVIFSLADAFSGSTISENTVLQYRTDINVLTSFTGKDFLLMSLWAGNTPNFPRGFGLPGETVGGIPTVSPEGSLSSQFGGNSDNSLYVPLIKYQSPIGNKLTVSVDAFAGSLFGMVDSTANPYLDDQDSGMGAVSAFGQRNPIYSLSAGSGVGLNYQLSDQLTLSAVYQAETLSASNPSRGGLFNGGYAALGQLTWQPSQQFTLAATYLNSYYKPGRFGFSYNNLPLVGTSVANTLAGQTRLTAGIAFDIEPVVANSYGLQASYQVSPKFVINGWVGATYARLIGEGDGTILNYAVNFAFPDLGKDGNLLGLVVGAEPYLTNFRGGNPQPFRVDVPWHIEAFYRYQLNDRLAITPAVIWLTAPNQDRNNPDAIIGVVRTTFKF